jgi:F-type H+-transporting ATPase subunit delta
MHKVTADFQNLDIFLTQAPEFLQYLNNPLVSIELKREILSKILQLQINKETFQFLLVLVKRNRINLLQSIIESYFQLVYRLASIKMIEVSSAFPFTNRQKNILIKKLKEITKAREIRLFINVDSSLIGGFLVKTDSKVLDFTIKNQLEELAKHLDSVLEI